MFVQYSFKKFKCSNSVNTTNFLSHYTRSLENFRVKQHRLNGFRNLPQEVGSKFVHKFSEELQILDDP